MEDHTRWHSAAHRRCLLQPLADGHGLVHLLLVCLHLSRSTLGGLARAALGTRHRVLRLAHLVLTRHAGAAARRLSALARGDGRQLGALLLR